MGTKKIISFLGIVIILFSLNLYCHTREMTLKEKVNKSDLIVIGEVQDVESRWDERHSDIFTYVTVSIEECIKGSNNLEIITIRILGGSVINEEGVLIGEIYTGWVSPGFMEKEKVFLFLKLIPDEEYYAVLNSVYGKYKIYDDNNVSNTNYSKEELVNKIKSIMASEEKK